MRISSASTILSCAIISLGIALSGYFIGQAIQLSKAKDRIVTVKGLAEKEIPANLAIWSLHFKRSGNDLSVLQQKIEDDLQLLTGFLSEQGFLSEEMIKNKPPKLTDHHEYGVTDQNAPKERYVIKQVITLRTSNIEKIRNTLNKTGELIKRGIILNNEYDSGPEYIFTQLNSIKPDMIAQATRNARNAAEQFASDSGSKVGSIRSANQGLFSIDERDSSSPDIKLIRVVSTLEFFLVD